MWDTWPWPKCVHMCLCACGTKPQFWQRFGVAATRWLGACAELPNQSVCFAFSALISCHVRLTRWYTSAGYTLTKRIFDNYKTTIWQLYDNLFDNLFDNCISPSFSHSRHKFHEISKNVSPFGYCMRWKLQKTMILRLSNRLSNRLSYSCQIVVI